MSERLSRLTVRLEVSPHFGQGRAVEHSLQMDYPSSLAQDLEQIEWLIAVAMADLRRFYGLSYDAGESKS